MTSWLREYLPDHPPSRSALGWLLLPALVAVVLLVFDRYGIEVRFLALFQEDLSARGMSPNQIRFYAQIWMTGACFVLMVILPTFYLWVFPNLSAAPPPTRQRDWGLQIPTQPKVYAIYGVLMAGMFPLLWWVSAYPEFNLFYPLYNPETLTRWILFEVAYLSQFFCVEYFFRGPLLFRLNHRFGYAAIGMMVVPYALIHIYKPFPEALGSIVAGYLLGYLALKVRSIWPGVALHCGVALTMDTLALLRSGRLEALLS